jgi:hypothetical protein
MIILGFLKDVHYITVYLGDNEMCRFWKGNEDEMALRGIGTHLHGVSSALVVS